MNQRDDIAQALMNQNTGGLGQQDFETFAGKVGAPELKGWLDAGGIYGQMGLSPPDPDEQYFARKGPVSGSPGEVDWLQNLQPWQGGIAGGETINPIPGSLGGWIGQSGGMRASPSYWGWQGPHQGYSPGSMGDLSGFNNNRGLSASGTGGLSSSDAATFSRLVGPQAFQEWLNAGGVQGQFGGSMGGSAGGGSGGSSGGSLGGGGGAVGGGGGIATVAKGGDPSSAGLSGYTYGPPGTPSAAGLNSLNSTGAGVVGGFGPAGLNAYGNTIGIGGYGVGFAGAATDSYGNPMGNGPFGAGAEGVQGGNNNTWGGGDSSTGWGGF